MPFVYTGAYWGQVSLRDEGDVQLMLYDAWFSETTIRGNGASGVISPSVRAGLDPLFKYTDIIDHINHT